MSIKDELTQEIEALQGLVRSPGWAILTKRIKAQSDVQMTLMRNAKSQDELLKATYTYMALADLPDAPAILIKTLGSKLQEHVKAK